MRLRMWGIVWIMLTTIKLWWAAVGRMRWAVMRGRLGRKTMLGTLCVGRRQVVLLLLRWLVMMKRLLLWLLLLLLLLLLSLLLLLLPTLSELL